MTADSPFNRADTKPDALLNAEISTCIVSYPVAVDSCDFQNGVRARWTSRMHSVGTKIGGVGSTSNSRSRE